MPKWCFIRKIRDSTEKMFNFVTLYICNICLLDIFKKYIALIKCPFIIPLIWRNEKGNIIIPEGEPMVHTISCDEKPGIQAIATTSEDLRPSEDNGCVYRDYEYKRLGTLSLFAGIDLLTGQVIPVVSETHKSSDFISLLKKFDELYPEGDVIRIICDNHSAHKSKEVQNYLATRPEGRFVFVFTPTHGSWLNLIESFFSKMTKQMLKGIRVKSKEELAERIYLYFDEVNANPVVYHWTYKLDEISVDEAKNNVAI